MEVFASPGLIPYLELELFEAAFKGPHLWRAAACPNIPPCEIPQILSNQARQRGVAAHGYLANPFHQVFWERKSDLHTHMRRESPISRKPYSPLSSLVSMVFVLDATILRLAL